jgi:hypothetical protein
VNHELERELEEAMNMPITKTQREVFLRVSAVRDPVAECRRRWPDFRFEIRDAHWPLPAGATKPKRKATFVAAFWSAPTGVPRGLQHDAGKNPSPAEVETAKQLLARQALINDEYRRRSPL